MLRRQGSQALLQVQSVVLSEGGGILADAAAATLNCLQYVRLPSLAQTNGGVTKVT